MIMYTCQKVVLTFIRVQSSIYMYLIGYFKFLYYKKTL